MGWINDARKELAAGREVQVRPVGGSMRGRIESGQFVTLTPVAPAEVHVDDVVLVEWKGNFLLRLVKEMKGDQLLIGNNLGKVNGWVSASAVVGKVIAVGDLADGEPSAPFDRGGVTTKLRTENQESWQSLLRFIDSFPDDDWYRKWRNTVRPLVEGVISCGLDQFFRAGQSMTHLIISTAERPGLETITPSPPRVTLAVTPAHELFIAWSHANIWFKEPERRSAVTNESAMPTLKSYLKDLWAATRPDETVPETLDESPDKVIE